MNITQLMEKITALWPKAFDTPDKFKAWSETYREQLGHLAPAALSEAWRRTMAGYTGMRPPMPADILANVPDNRAPLLAGVAQSKTRAGMAVELPELMSDLLTDFWRHQGTWFDQELETRGIEEDRRRAVRWTYNEALRRIAHYQAQEIYWKGGDRILNLDTAGGYFRLWLDSAWHAGRKQAKPRPAAERSGLGDLARQIVGRSIDATAVAAEAPAP